LIYHSPVNIRVNGDGSHGANGDAITASHTLIVIDPHLLVPDERFRLFLAPLPYFN
jgi:hypothetical protein